MRRGQVQAQAGAVRLVGGERLKELVVDFGRDAGPGVADLQDHRPIFRGGQIDFEPASRPHRIEGVEEQIDQHRDDLPRVRRHDHRLARQIERRLHLLLPGPHAHQLPRLPDDVAQIARGNLRRRQPGEIQELLHRLLKPLDLAIDDLRILQVQRLRRLLPAGRPRRAS